MKTTMRKHITLLLILFPVCGHLLDFAYYTDSNSTTWESAQAFCRKHHTDLVKIRNERESESLNGFGWIGLYRENATSPWKWSKGDEEATFPMWDTDEPKEDGNCVYTNDGKWGNKDCDDMHSFLCYDEKLILVKENKTWEEALDHCRSMDGVDTNDSPSSYWNHRYDLATLITPDDHTAARERAQEATTDEVWTGLCNLAGEWLWVGGEKMQYEDIPSCPTDGFCGVLEKNGTASYGIRDCQLRRNFLCYKRTLRTFN